MKDTEKCKGGWICCSTCRRLDKSVKTLFRTPKVKWSGPSGSISCNGHKPKIYF